MLDRDKEVVENTENYARSTHTWDESRGGFLNSNVLGQKYFTSKSFKETIYTMFI